MRCSLTNQQAEVLKNLIDKQKEYSLAELERIYEENKAKLVSFPISNNQPETPWSGEVDIS
jgi:hypothetical protein